jgi:hypothetical protein
VGEPLDVWYDYKRLGIWQNTPEDSAEAKRLGLATGNASVIGTIKLLASGPAGKPDGKIDATYDRSWGTVEPWEGGMTQRVSYMGIDLPWCCSRDGIR